MALAHGAEAFSLTEAFDGVDTEYAALSVIDDGVPQLYVETVADGQAAWQYDIFFAGPHLANIPELTIFDEGTGDVKKLKSPQRTRSIMSGHITTAQSKFRVL